MVAFSRHHDGTLALDAPEHEVRVGIAAFRIMHVVGRDLLEPVVDRQVVQDLVQGGLLGQVVVLKLHVQRSRLEALAEPPEEQASLMLTLVQDALR